MKTYRYIVVLKSFSCGCVIGMHSLSHDCDTLIALRRAGDIDGCFHHFDQEPDAEVQQMITTKWNTEDRSSVGKPDETAAEMKARMLKPRTQLFDIA